SRRDRLAEVSDGAAARSRRRSLPRYRQAAPRLSAADHGRPRGRGGRRHARAGRPRGLPPAAQPAGALAEAAAAVRAPRDPDQRAVPAHVGIESTILPNCSPASRRSWAVRASASGKTESITGFARPDATSSYAPSKSAFVPIVEP